MSGSISVNIPIKRYLKKYLEKKLGEKYRVNRTDWLGNYVIDLLDKQYRRKGSAAGEDYYKIIIPSSIVNEVGFNMSATKMKHFESMIDKVFRNDMESYIDITVVMELYSHNSRKFRKENVMQAMSRYLEFFEITEDDIKLETLYKYYKRKKKPVLSLDTLKVAM